ncbi:MAG: hypothetical protein MJ250_01655 [Alphaproteobacteria bacterium]|nr:hypothetical protein [Alphaproteobacteria bacterium]
MIIELAHYMLIFSLFVIGLQTSLLMPTLWSKGNAIAIKLGFRGTFFSSALIFISYFILILCYIRHDYSVAIVFENFNQDTPFYSILTAILSSREGFLYTAVLVQCVCCLMGFLNKNLTTYQERGRYLCCNGAFVLLELLLLIETANPFERIIDPPMTGLGLQSNTLELLFCCQTLFLFISFGLLMDQFLAAVCMISKKHDFAPKIYEGTFFAFIFMMLSLCCNVALKTMNTKGAGFIGWMPSYSLEAGILIFIFAQLIILKKIVQYNIFKNTYLNFSIMTLIFIVCDIFAKEYRLFTLNTVEMYFPNPIIALSATSVFICLAIGFTTTLIKSKQEEELFYFHSKQTLYTFLIGICNSNALCLSLISLLPSLFIFIPNFAFKEIPSIIQKICFVHFILFAVVWDAIKLFDKKLNFKTILFYTLFVLCTEIILIHYHLGFFPIPVFIAGYAFLTKYEWKIPEKITKERIKNIFKMFDFFIFTGIFTCALSFDILAQNVSFTGINLLFDGIFFTLYGLYWKRK